MRQNPVSAQAVVTLDGSGNGQCSLSPPSGTRWDLALATVAILNPVNIPQLILSLGHSGGPLTLIDSTYSGASGSSSKVRGTPLYSGTYIWASWTGGDPGAQAQLQVYGSQVTGYRSAA